MLGALSRTVSSSFAARTVMAQQKRGLLLYVCNDNSMQDQRSINQQWGQAILDADGMGCDEAPHFRRVSSSILCLANVVCSIFNIMISLFLFYSFTSSQRRLVKWL
jgi:hypothetical protein